MPKAHALSTPAVETRAEYNASLPRLIVIATMAFSTVVDLFAAQPLLPSLVTHYGVSPAAMGLAVNASTFGMAAAGLAVSLFGARIDARVGVVASLVVLALPTALLAIAPSLEIFAALRVVQGLLMAAAFSLTLGYLGETFSARDAASAFAAYITGNVASNLIGRLIATTVVAEAGLATTFLVFAGLNLAGAALAYVALRRTPASGSQSAMPEPMGVMSAWRAHLADPALRAAFGIGFAILFAFIGTFTFINFVLSRPPLSVGMMQLGLLYFVFLPSILTTPFAGRLDARLGTERALRTSLGLAGLGLPMLLAGSLPLVLAGMTLIAAGTFAAQAIATSFVGRRASVHRSAASGIYLASYYLGGLMGTAVLGQLFDGAGWPACVAGIAASLAAAAWLSRRLGSVDRRDQR